MKPRIIKLLLICSVIYTLIVGTSCIYNGAIHREYLNGQLIRQDEVGQMSFCYFTDKRNIEFDLYKIATLYIGRSTQMPDPNTVETITKGAIVIGGGL